MSLALRKPEAARSLANRDTLLRREPGAGNSEHLSCHDFDRLAQFIHLRSGIKMPAGKQTMLEARLRRRILALGMASFAEYCHYLFEEGGLDEETTALIDAVTTNKTDFFREAEHFRFLTENGVPALFAECRDLRHSPLKVWSAACSNGAEPYTLAMVLSELSGSVRAFTILATDICTEVLKTAVRGIYPASMAAPIPPGLRQRYLLRSKDSAADSIRVPPQLRRSIRFGRLNLISTPYGADTSMHAIFCRNVLIYFDKHNQRKVASELCRHLQPGGFLFVGHSESLNEFDLPLRQVSATIFRRL
jgi:chemotaxis protein methyltransferase CheR